MYQNTQLKMTSVANVQYYYIPSNGASADSDYDSDPLTYEEIEDIKKSMEDIKSGNYVRLKDKASISSFLNGLKQ